MPHLIMEHSQGVKTHLDTKMLLAKLHQATIDSGLFAVEDVKSRSIEFQDWLVGEFDPAIDFIHVSCAILEGRNDTQKAQLSQRLFDILQSLEFTCSITVEIRDMEKSGFHKDIL